MEGALGAHRRATELAPDYGFAWSALSEVARELGLDEEALEASTRAADLDSDDPAA
jgi:tetratricopeptide (TPR) repeat protein